MSSRQRLLDDAETGTSSSTRPMGSRLDLPGQPKKVSPTITAFPLPTIALSCLLPFYPSLDYTLTRQQRRATIPMSSPLSSQPSLTRRTCPRPCRKEARPISPLLSRRRSC